MRNNHYKHQLLPPLLGNFSLCILSPLSVKGKSALPVTGNRRHGEEEIAMVVTPFINVSQDCICNEGRIRYDDIIYVHISIKSLEAI